MKPRVKPRRVLVTLELECDLLLGRLRQATMWEELLFSRRSGFHDPRVEQVQVNVIRAEKPRRKNRRKRGLCP